MNVKIYFGLFCLVFILSFSKSSASLCPSCPKDVLPSCAGKQVCKYGEIVKECECCTLCAKGPGEKCKLGSDFCAKGLTCKKVTGQTLLFFISERVCLSNRRKRSYGGYRPGMSPIKAKKHLRKVYGSGIPFEALKKLRKLGYSL